MKQIPFNIELFKQTDKYRPVYRNRGYPLEVIYFTNNDIAYPVISNVTYLTYRHKLNGTAFGGKEQCNDLMLEEIPVLMYKNVYASNDVCDVFRKATLNECINV